VAYDGLCGWAARRAAASCGPGAHTMIQCKDCQYFRRGEDGQIAFACDPFSTIVEPECLQKWQLLKINQMVASYQSMLEYYRKLAPLQEKMFKVVENEIDSMNEGEQWKVSEDEEEEDQDTPTGDWDAGSNH
jgi:hypothetical protein